MQYRDDGYLPEALVNYLARLGWSHGDEEMFSREQLVEWFDLEHVSRSPAQFDPREARVAQPAVPEGSRRPSGWPSWWRRESCADGGDPARGPSLVAVVALLKERAQTLEELADAAVYFYADIAPKPELLAAARHRRGEARAARAGRAASRPSSRGRSAGIQSAFEGALKAHGLKMPKLAMPLRVVVTGDDADAVDRRDARAGRARRACSSACDATPRRARNGVSFTAP